MTLCSAHHLSAPLFLALMLLGGGCAPDASKVDSNRSYFEGGALQAPNPSTVVMTGRVLRSQGRISEAEFVLRRVVSEHPEYAPGYSELAELLLKDGRSQETVILLEAGTALIPTSAMLHNDLGMCFVVSREFESARQEFLVATELAPEDAVYAANYAMDSFYYRSFYNESELREGVLNARYELSETLTLRAGVAYHRFQQDGRDLFYDDNVNGTRTKMRGTSVGDVTSVFSNDFGSWLIGDYGKAFAKYKEYHRLGPNTDGTGGAL